MQKRLSRVYRRLFARPSLARWNRFLLRQSLHGLGVLNYESPRVSGEHWLVSRLAAAVPQPVVIDIGAHKGAYAAMVRAACPTASILAIEPHKGTFGYLQDEARRNHFSAVNAACGARPGHGTLYDYDSLGATAGSSHASLHEEVIELLHSGAAAGQTVDVATVDALISTQSWSRVHLLKIDTEGSEYDVLLGAAESINAGIIDAVQFEFNEMNVVSRHFLRDFADVLTDYTLYRLLPSGLIPFPEPYTPVEWELFAYQNILAVHDRCRWPFE